MKEDLKNLKKKMFPNNDGVPHCITCGKPMINAYDKVSKKISKYTWKHNCNCIENKSLRLSIG